MIFMQGSIRQYQKDSAKWVVTYFSYPSVSSAPSTWMGSKNGEGNIVLDRPYTAANGMEGTSRLIFFNISEKGFNWNGEWISLDKTVLYPFWSIWCKKVKQAQ